MNYEDEFEREYEDDRPDEPGEEQDVYSPEERADDKVDQVKIAKTMYHLSPAPPEWDLQKYIDEYVRKKDEKYLCWFLHYYESAINKRAEGYMIQYAMSDNGYFQSCRKIRSVKRKVIYCVFKAHD